MFYLQSTADGSIWLALCLYNFSVNKSAYKYEGVIINTRTGEIVDTGFKNILTSREKAVLQLIKRGKRSKEIAEMLSISQHTVHRHRQNILEKLHVTNSMEACRIAESINLI
jgi:DNA-binding NarL/FixJ family response regulator